VIGLLINVLTVYGLSWSFCEESVMGVKGTAGLAVLMSGDVPATVPSSNLASFSRVISTSIYICIYYKYREENDCYVFLIFVA
jgi:hypothetical protein